MEQVISLLFEIVNDTGAFQLVSFAQMTLTECMELAYKVNSNADIPMLATCVPDLTNTPVVH